MSEGAALTALDPDEVRVYTLDTGERIRVRAAVRVILAHHAGVAPEAIEITSGPKGKPLLASDLSLHFSYSHSHGVALVAVTRVGPVGVDVERARPVVPITGTVLRRFFGEKEAGEILAADDAGYRYVLAWTRAESAVKARGGSVWEGATPDPSIVVRALVAPQGYAASVAVIHPAWRLTQVALRASDLGV